MRLSSPLALTAGQAIANLLDDIGKISERVILRMANDADLTKFIHIKTNEAASLTRASYILYPKDSVEIKKGDLTHQNPILGIYASAACTLYFEVK